MEQAFTIRIASSEDIDAIMEIMGRAKGNLPEESQWFVADGWNYVEMHAKRIGGFTVVAENRERKVVAFFSVDFPGERADNLGFDSRLEEQERMRVAHMDSTVVLPEYRGNHLMETMLSYAEKELIGTPYRYFLSTVHPDNHYSLNIMKRRGYQIVAQKEKYGGLPRYILYKRKEKPAILVSACLLGTCCRYDEGGVMDPKVQAFMQDAILIPVCPEVFGGLPTPRIPSERVGDQVLTKDGQDVTRQYRKGAQEVWKLAELYQAPCALLKERSPSCGCGQIYDGTYSRKLVEGDGVTAELLKKHGIRVFGESKTEELKDFIDTI